MTVCAKCNDTHKVWSAAHEQWWGCTSCPSPCPWCNDGSAYCKTTPCPCSCHTSDGSGRRDRYQPVAPGKPFQTLHDPVNMPIFRAHVDMQERLRVLEAENERLLKERNIFRRLIQAVVEDTGHPVSDEAVAYLRDHP